MICAWLAAWLEVIFDKPIERSRGNEPSVVRTYLAELAAEQPVRYARKYLRESALVAALLLLCPESGCAAELAAELLDGGDVFVSALDDVIVRKVREARASVYAAARRVNQPRNEFRLLSAISPKRAVHSYFTEYVKDRLQPLAMPPETWSGIQAGPHDPRFDTALANLEQSPSIDQGVRGDVEFLRSLPSRHGSHPLNLLLESRLVPTNEEIDKALGRSQRQR